MKKIYLILVMVFGLITVNTQAQLSSYVFTPSGGSFTPITGGTAVSTTTSVADFLGDTKTSISLPLGFNFKFNGVNYSSVRAMSDGYLSFNLSATSSLTNNLSSSTSRPLVAPLWDDLDGASGTGAANYITEGAVGSRIFTMEWLNWQWNYNATGATISFQVKLYEGSNAIEFIYREESGAVTSASASIGIAAIGTGSGNFISLNNSTAAPTASITTETTSINLKPATGQVYRFEPNPVPVVMDYVNLQFPPAGTIALGGSLTVYTQGYEPGVTEAAGAGTGVQAWIGVNGANTDPATWTTWVPATFNVQVDNNDEFQANIGSTLGAGTHYYASRWQLNTGEYRYGGFPNGYWNGTTQTSGVLTVTPSLANDVCSGAISLTVNADLACGVTTAGTTVGATQSPDLPAPTCSATGINDDVWFSFVATAASHVITITGATNTTASQVYSGSCGSLVALACASTTSGTLNQTITGLVIGNTYYSRVYSTSTALATTSNFTICVGTPPLPPANDECAAAVVLTANPDLTCVSPTAGTTLSATQSAGTVPTCNATGINDDVWYSFNATGATHRVSITGASNTTAAQVYSGTCGALVAVACGATTAGDLSLSFSGLTIGDTYYVRVFTTSTVVGTSSNFNICILTPPAPPANDVCSGAIAIPCDGSISGNSSNATIDLLPGITCGSTTSTVGTNYGVWFTVTPAFSGSMTISTCTGTLYDTYLRVYGGACDAFTTCIASDDDGCAETLYGLSSVTFTAVGGTTYYILLGGYDNADFGDYTISATCPAACPAPATPTMSAVTATTATATWASTGSFILEYGPAGYTPGTAGTAGVGGTLVDPAVSPQAITGLTASTTYDLYVRQVCTGPTWSANSAIRTFTTAPTPPITSVASGDWNAGSTWSSGVVPVCADNIQIEATHNVTVSSAGNVSKQLTIATGGTLTVSSGDLTVGCTSNNSSLSNNGTLTITGGTVQVNGRVALNSASTYNMSGGNLNIDPNDGTVGGSVVSGTATFAVGSSSAAMTTNVTGGNILINDPPFAGNGYSVVMNTNTNTTWVGSTIQFGGTSNTNVSTATNGFRVDCWFNSGRLAFGNVIINGNDVTKPVTDVSFGINAAGDLTVNSGSELRIATSLSSFAGNITNNGIITATSALSLQLITGVNSTAVATPNAQAIGGSGVFRNLVASPTAELNGLTVNNSSAAGVTLNVPLRISGSLTLTAGMVNTTPTNLLTVGFSGTGLGSISRTAGMVNGPLKKWYGAATGSATLPLSNGVSYKPATLNFTTAPATAGTLTGNFSSVAPDFPNASPLTEGALIVNKASTQGSWFVEAGDGLTGGLYTATFTGNGTTDVIDYTKTVLIKRPTAGGDWTLDGVHVTSTGSNAAPVVSRTGMSGFSEFAIGGELLVALPITIEFFKGSKQSNGHLLDWKVTCYNSPTVTMQLERSADGRKYTSINSQTETSLRCLQPFSYTDAAPLAGINYYRLKSIDIDGKVTYSTVVALLNKEKGFEIVSLVPNPVQTQAVLSVTSANKSMIEIVVSDLSGKQLSKQRVNLISGNNLLPINVRNLPAGTYQVSGLTADGVSRTLRFVKQ